MFVWISLSHSESTDSNTLIRSEIVGEIQPCGNEFTRNSLNGNSTPHESLSQSQQSDPSQVFHPKSTLVSNGSHGGPPHGLCQRLGVLSISPPCLVNSEPVGEFLLFWCPQKLPFLSGIYILCTYKFQRSSFSEILKNHGRAMGGNPTVLRDGPPQSFPLSFALISHDWRCLGLVSAKVN